MNKFGPKTSGKSREPEPEGAAKSNISRLQLRAVARWQVSGRARDAGI